MLKTRPMTQRIEARFEKCRVEGRAALVTYVMAGDPDPETSLAILKSLPKAGADIVEFGLPFTDPMADGPAIQAAGLRALKVGQDTVKTLDLIRRFRADDERRTRALAVGRGDDDARPPRRSIEIGERAHRCRQQRFGLYGVQDLGDSPVARSVRVPPRGGFAFGHGVRHAVRGQALLRGHADGSAARLQREPVRFL